MGPTPPAESRETITPSLQTSLQPEELNRLKKRTLQERGCYCHTSFLPRLLLPQCSCPFLPATPEEAAARSCVLPLLLPAIAPPHGPLVPHTSQGKVSKVKHCSACQSMAKFASMCYELICQEEVEQTGLCLVFYVVLIKHSQVRAYQYVFS